MKKITFKVTLNPKQLVDFLKDNSNYNLLHEEIKNLGNGVIHTTMIFEKYYIRVANRLTIVVLSDNLNGDTIVTAIVTGISKGLLVSYDLGAKGTCLKNFKNLLQEFIIE